MGEMLQSSVGLTARSYFAAFQHDTLFSKTLSATSMKRPSWYLVRARSVMSSMLKLQYEMLTGLEP